MIIGPFCAVIKDEHSAKPQDIFISNFTGNQREKDLLVDAHEVVFNTKLDIIGRIAAISSYLLYKLLKAHHSQMNPFASAAGIGIVDKD
jgi:hypothetical protein